MKDNLERGSRLIFWLKVDFVLLSLLSLFAITFLNLFGFAESFDPDTIMALDILGISLILLFLCGAFLLVITLILSFVFWINWFYRAIQNANHFSKTFFSPLLSVLLSLIPGLGVILHFFIIKDLVRKTELWLQRRKMKFVKIKQFLINSWFILMLLNIVADSFESDELRIILGLFTLGFYIAILSKYAKHESKLFQACREEEIRKQVEVVLEQRERKSS